jgi:hypothetical protein
MLKNKKWEGYMFIGHYAAAFAVRAYNPTGPKLGALFVGAQAVDYGFFGLSLLGIERSAHNSSLQGLMPIDLLYMPFTHSLIPATLVWALAGALIAAFLAPKGAKAAFAWGMGLVVASHWFIDLPVHRPDLGLLWETPKLGFGLWNYPSLAMGLELSVIALGIALYAKVRAYRSLSAAIPLLVLVIALLVSQGVNWFTPAPMGLLAINIPPLISYSLLAALAMWADQAPQIHSSY